MLSFISNANYSGSYLNSNDPTNFVSLSGEILDSLSSITLPLGYIVCVDWVVKGISYRHLKFTDMQGYKYNSTFENDGWMHSELNSSQVRTRLWQRMIVNTTCIDHALSALDRFEIIKRSYRSLNLNSVQIALNGNEYYHQIIMESQRSTDGVAYSSTLLINIEDPPEWSCSKNIRIDPRALNCTLERMNPNLTKLSDGFDLVHDFLFLLYPGGDEEGWEYNTAFASTCVTDWSSSAMSHHRVRRRIWFRTCARSANVDKCRHILQRYLDTHSRGVVFRGKINRLSDYRKIWSEGEAFVIDDRIEINLKNYYRKQVSYPLRGCVAVVVRQDMCGGVDNVFCIRCFERGGNELICTLQARNVNERNLWMTVLTHHLCVLHVSFWPIAFGPPLNERVIAIGDMWTHDGTWLIWKRRHFELRENGLLSYFKKGVLKGKTNVMNCLISKCDDTISIISKINGHKLLMRSSNSEALDNWYTALTSHMVTANIGINEGELV